MKTAEGFPAAKTYLRDPKLPRPESGSVADEDIVAFREAQPAFIAHLNRKLRLAMPSATPEKLVEYAEQWLRWHLKSANLLDHLFNSFPNLWEELDELIEVTGQSIETEEAVDTRPPVQRLRETRHEFETKLDSTEFEFLTTSDRTSVSYGTVAKWLGECPLDFPGDSNG